jgi:hypothetical protein
MKSEALSVVEADAKIPLLPFEMIALDVERRTFRLDYLVWLGSSSRAGSQVRVIFACSRGMDPSTVERPLFIVDPFVWRGR